MAKKPRKAKTTIEPTVKTAKPVEEEELLVAKELKPTPSTTEAAPEEKVEVEIPTKEEPVAKEQPKLRTLDEQLLDIYNTAPPGRISLTKVMVQTGVEEPILIKQAWDRLYDQHKVPFTKLFKPPLGHIGIE